jgi:hypothetical protein
MGGPSRDDVVALVRGQRWVRSWQHEREVHLEGCPRNNYYIASCSDACSAAHTLARRCGVSLPDPKDLPSGYESRGGGVENYG